MTDPVISNTGIVRVEELGQFGFEADVAIAVGTDGEVLLVQFNPLGNLQDVWDGVSMRTLGFVPAQRNDGEVGPVGLLPPQRIGGGSGPVGVLPPIRIGGGTGPVGVKPRLRIAARPSARSTLPPIRLGDGDGAVGALPPVRLVEGTGAMGILPPNSFGGGSGPVGILPPIRIGGGSGPVGQVGNTDSPDGVIALAFAKVTKNEAEDKHSVQVTLRVLGDDPDSVQTIGQFNAEVFMDKPLLKRASELAGVQSLDEYRTHIKATAFLDLRDRDLLVDQAIVLLDDIYAHLPLKRAMHAIDPVQRLRLLKQRAPKMDVLDFHAELLTIFKELRDLHTNLSLPVPFGRQIAFLGVLVERFFVDGVPRYVVSKVYDNLVTDDDFEAGVEITHWNGLPIQAAVTQNADKEAGSNIPSRIARGLETLTLRWLSTSLMPEEDWVDLTYIKDNEIKHTRLHWLVFDSAHEIKDTSDGPMALSQHLSSPPAFNLAFDERQEVFRMAKKELFNPTAMKLAADVADIKGNLKEITKLTAASGSVATTRPDEILARIVSTPDGEFGYLRLWTFLMEDGNIEQFLLEVMRLLDEKIPANGLIIDVRGNGGGYVIAAEFLLQLLTPRQIQPEPAQFVATASALEFVKNVKGMEPWQASLEQAVETGALYSKGRPISPPDLVNSVGQIFFGPIVLITDAYCYSACDMFAAGFQDHEIGTILGVDQRTGAGGANVVTQDSLVSDWPAGPFRKLPGNAGMRVSLRRTMRVGQNAGNPVEDLGVTPDKIHETTLRDVMESNADLIEKAIAILKDSEKPACKFDLSIGGDGNLVKLQLDTLAIDSVEVYVGGRHLKTKPVDDDRSVRFEFGLTDGDTLIELVGYKENRIVAKREIMLQLN